MTMNEVKAMETAALWKPWTIHQRARLFFKKDIPTVPTVLGKLLPRPRARSQFPTVPTAPTALYISNLKGKTMKTTLSELDPKRPPVPL